MRSTTFISDPSFVASIRGGGKLSADEALAVYSRGYVARLTEALGETFEACWRVLGDERFFAAAAEYIRRNPSRSANLSDYGDNFLRCQAFESFEFPFLGDLATYEWEFKELFHVAPHRGLDAATLSARAKPDSRFRFGSAHRLLCFQHRVYPIWKRDRNDDSPLDPGQWQGPEHLLIYKKEGNSIFVRELSAAEFATLNSLRDGRTLADALESAPGMDAEAAQSLFGFIADSGLITDVS